MYNMKKGFGGMLLIFSMELVMGGFVCSVRMLNHFMSDYALMILLFHSNIVVKQ